MKIISAKMLDSIGCKLLNLIEMTINTPMDKVGTVSYFLHISTTTLDHYLSAVLCFNSRWHTWYVRGLIL